MNFKNLTVALVLGSLVVMGCSKKASQVKPGAKPATQAKPPVAPSNPAVAPKPAPVPKDSTPVAPVPTATSVSSVIQSDWFGPCADNTITVAYLGNVTVSSSQVVETITANTITQFTRYYVGGGCSASNAYDGKSQQWTYQIMKDGAVDGAPMNLDYLVYNNGQQADSNDDNSDTMKVVEDTDAEGYWILKLDYSDVNEVQFTRYQK